MRSVWKWKGGLTKKENQWKTHPLTHNLVDFLSAQRQNEVINHKTRLGCRRENSVFLKSHPQSREEAT